MSSQLRYFIISTFLSNDIPLSKIRESHNEAFATSRIIRVLEGLHINKQLQPVLLAVLRANCQCQVPGLCQLDVLFCIILKKIEEIKSTFHCHLYFACRAWVVVVDEGSLWCTFAGKVYSRRRSLCRSCRSACSSAQSLSRSQTGEAQSRSS